MATLKRHFSLLALLLYGIGDILGAGIYALVGKVTEEAGSYAPLSFVFALIVAVLTALGYAELASRLPKSGGVSYFSEKAFSNEWVSFFSGWILICTCLFSIATLSLAFFEYFKSFDLDFGKVLVILIFIACLTAINLRGISHSSIANIVATVVEVSGLVFVIFVASKYLLNTDIEPVATKLSLSNVLKGSAVAFFAFIGFEDIANVAEEVKNPEKTLSKAIVSSVLITGCIYIAVVWLSVRVVSPLELAKSNAPLNEVIRSSGYDRYVEYFAVVALFAVANTCLLNSITASRLLYGMSEQGLMPKIFGHIHHKTNTPIYAVLIVSILAFALTFLNNLKQLAGTTSFLILTLFTITNLSLIKVKRMNLGWDGFRIPAFIPWLAIITNITLLFFTPVDSKYALVIILFIGFLLKKFLH